jgi:formamidopyrimidine-DNA glycosylase
MPELPEVETIRSQLQKYIVGHKIVSVEVRNRKIFPNDEKQIIGATFKDIRRFGKVLVMDLDLPAWTDYKFSIVAHIKLTGQFIYRGPNLPHPSGLSKKVVGGVPGSHTHVIFNLDKGGVLYYNDVRRFGWIKLARSVGGKVQSEFIAKLGPEPFKDLDLRRFKQIISKTKRPIKIVLMDQSKLGGVGNIYANDALWLSAISPQRPANTLSLSEQSRLYDAILEVLGRGMKYGGASELAFVTPDGKEGEYQDHTLVYGRQGTSCKRCGTKIIKNILGGRGTYFCPSCQR